MGVCLVRLRLRLPRQGPQGPDERTGDGLAAAVFRDQQQPGQVERDTRPSPAIVRTTKARRMIITSTPRSPGPGPRRLRPPRGPGTPRRRAVRRDPARSSGPAWSRAYQVLTVFVFMAPAWLRGPGQHIGKTPGEPLIPAPRNQGNPAAAPHRLSEATGAFRQSREWRRHQALALALITRVDGCSILAPYGVPRRMTADLATPVCTGVAVHGSIRLRRPARPAPRLGPRSRYRLRAPAPSGRGWRRPASAPCPWAR